MAAKMIAKVVRNLARLATLKNAYDRDDKELKVKYFVLK